LRASAALSFTQELLKPAFRRSETPVAGSRQISRFRQNPEEI
jgi:hypothetical protein